MRCISCGNEFEHGRALSEGGPEVCCSHRCVEEIRRGPDMEYLREIAARAEQQMGERCRCPLCARDEAEEAQCDRSFGSGFRELSGVRYFHLCKTTNAAMRDAGVRVGDLLVWCGASGSNADFAPSLPGFVAKLSSEDGDVFAFAPGDRIAVLIFIATRQIREAPDGPEPDSLKDPTTGALKSALAQLVPTPEWEATISDAIQAASLKLFGPRQVGRMVTENDIAVA